MNHPNSIQFSPFMHWIMNHLRAMLFALGELLNAPVTSLMTIIVIGTVMALPAGLYLLFQNLQNASEYWHQSPSISLYVKQDIPEQQISDLVNELQKNPSISEVKYISPQQGMADFEKWTQMKDVLHYLNGNPLPGVIVVTPLIGNQQSPENMQNLFATLKELPQIETSQIDMLWVERLYYLLTIGKRIVYSMAILFAAGIVLIIGNTIRAVTQDKQQEILVLKLVGATHAFIGRPLHYRGFLYGILGGMVAWGLVVFMLRWLQIPAEALAKTYHQTLVIQGLDFQTGICIMLLCALLGWIGSWLALRWYLYASEEF